MNHIQEPEPPRLLETWTSCSRGGLHGGGAGSRSLTPPQFSFPGSSVPPVDGTKNTHTHTQKSLGERSEHFGSWCNLQHWWTRCPHLPYSYLHEFQTWHLFKWDVPERGCVATRTQRGSEGNICWDHLMAAKWKWYPSTGMLLKMDLGFCLAKPLLTIDRLPPNQAKG